MAAAGMRWSPELVRRKLRPLLMEYDATHPGAQASHPGVWWQGCWCGEAFPHGLLDVVSVWEVITCVACVTQNSIACDVAADMQMLMCLQGSPHPVRLVHGFPGGGVD